MKLYTYSDFINESEGRDVLVFGNPTYQQHLAIENHSDFRKKLYDEGLMQQWLSENPPAVNSPELIQSIENCIAEMNEASEEDVKFADEAEKSLYAVISNFMKNKGFDYSEESLKEIEPVLDPITFFLKNYFNYPRPFQSASYYNKPLYPLINTDSSSASYPSGHSLESHVLCILLAKKHPDLEVELMELANKISKSRVWSGVHYDFDDEQGRKIAFQIIESNLLPFEIAS